MQILKIAHLPAERVCNALVLFALVALLVAAESNASAQSKRKQKSRPLGQTQQSAKAEPAKQAVHRLIVNSFISDPELETHLVITDLDGASPTVHIQFYDENGVLLYDKYELLNAFGKINYDIYKVLGERKAAGTIRVESATGRIVGQYWQFYRDINKAQFDVALPASNGDGYTKLLCQHFGSVPDINSWLVIANAERDKPTVVNIKFYDDAGTIITMLRKVINPNGNIRIPIYETLKTTQLGVIYVDAEEDHHITGEYWERSDTKGFQIALPMDGTSKTR